MEETKTPTRKRTPRNGEAKATRRKRNSVKAETVESGSESSAMARSATLQAPPEKAFWVNGGPVLSDLKQLRDALAAQISEEQFVHHVTGDRNDFARWVEDVLGETECARALRQARSRGEALSVTEAVLGQH